jgi:hypothetical protein
MSSSSKGSPVTTNDSSDAGSMLGEQVPQQQILRQNKGLRHFSKQVCDKVELKGVTTYNEVGNEEKEDYRNMSTSLHFSCGHKNLEITHFFFFFFYFLFFNFF